MIKIKELEIEEEMLDRLMPREQRVIELLFLEGKTLEQTGKIMGITRERVRQLEAKALSRLRRFDSQEKFRQGVEAKENLKFAPIEDLNLSVRTYNCLKRAMIDSVEDLLEIPKDEFEIRMMNVKNLGRKSYKELVLALEKYKEEKSIEEIKQFKLEDFENKLGLNIITILTAMFSGYYYKKDGVIYRANCASLFVHYENGEATVCLDNELIDNFGKTWALRREVLENA